MRILSRGFVAISFVAGLVVASQAPEFAQQYRQRLGGAVDELRVVVSDFDRDAAGEGLNREQALQALRRSQEELPKARGESMAETIARFVSLRAQQQRLEETPALLRPMEVLVSPDRRIVEGAWNIFEPALPLTVAGAVWGLVGGLAGGGVARGMVGAGRRWRRRRNDRMLGLG